MLPPAAHTVSLNEELRLVFDALPGSLIDRPHLSPSHQPISSATIAAKHLASVEQPAEQPAEQSSVPSVHTCSPPRPLPPPVVPLTTTCPNAKYERYDGPFAKSYDPPPKLPTPSRESTTTAIDDSRLSAREARQAVARETGLSLRERYKSDGDILNARLDEQMRMLTEAHELAALAEKRAAAAVATNRVLLLVTIVVAATASYALTRAK